MAQPAPGGGLPFGEVTVPYLNYKMPTIALIVLALVILFMLHLVGLRFAVIVSASAS